MAGLPEKKPMGGWVQTERSAHEAWGNLVDESPKAAKLMHILTSRLGEHNAVVISQRTLMQLMKCSRNTVQRAVAVLAKERWIEVRQIGERGTVNAHIVNDRVAWTGARDGLRFSLFSATVVLSSDEQPDRAELGQQEPLRQLPTLFPGERQLPSGPGLPPPSGASLPGMELPLPAREMTGDEVAAQREWDSQAAEEVAALRERFAAGLRVDDETGEGSDE